MNKLTQGATRLLVLALGLGLASTGLAAISLEESGATVPTTSTLAFKNVTLSDLTTETLSGVFGGSWAGNAAGTVMTFNNFVRSEEESGTITCEAKVLLTGADNLRGVFLTFTQSGSDVYVQKTGAKYKTAETIDTSIDGGTDGNYDVSKLRLSIPSAIAPVAIFDGASGGFLKSSVNGVTFDANGNTVADDGSYVKISAAVGALFKLSSAKPYVVGEFTVTNLNESAAADRVLAIWSDNASGSGTTLGVYLPSGGVTTRGVWSNAAWNNDSDPNIGSANTLKTGVAVDSSRTFALATEDSNITTDNNVGTHLFELTGDNPGTAVYGGSAATMGLRSTSSYRTLVIGGPAAGSLSAATDLVITKVVIYASDSRQFSTVPTTTISNIANPAAFYVANGQTVNASAINAGVTASGSAYVYTEAGATLNLDAELVGRNITFVGSISGVPSTADVLTLGSDNDKVTMTNAAYVPVIKGCGTVIYPNNTIPSSDSTAWLTSTDWAGTLSLNNIQGSSNGQPGWYAPFHNYGSANSTIKVSGFTGFFAGGNYESPATLEIAAGSTFTLNNGNNGNSMAFAKLTGSGDLVICGDNGPAIQYVMRDASEFAGNITVSQSGSSNFKKSIVLGGGSSYNYNTSNYQKQICVLGNVTIAAGKTWAADNGIVVNGTLTKADSTATLSGTITGSGKIVYNDELPNSADFIANTWTGTVEVNGGTTTQTGIEAANAVQFMNSGSQFTVASGTVTLGTAAGLTGTVNVNSGATLRVVDESTTAHTMKYGTIAGNVNLAACTALTTLNLSCGASRTLGGFVFPSSLTTLNLTIAENATEDGEATVTLPTGSAVTTVSASVVDQNGVAKSATATLNGSSVAITFAPTVTGDACWHAYEFNNNWDDSVTVGAYECKTWNSDVPNFVADSDKDGNYFVYTSIRPGPTDDNGKVAYSFPSEWSAAIRCTVPQTANSIIVCFGKAANTTSSKNQYIALVSGDTAGKVRLVHGAGTGVAEDIAEMTVANPTSSQHVYVFTKTATTVTVYCDGDLITSKAVSASPYNGFQFGTMYGGMKTTSGLSAVTDKATGGVVDYTRLYNFAIGPNMIQKLAEDDPYVSSTPTYSREVSGNDVRWYTGDGTWLKSDDSTLVGVPDASGIVDVTATADATMTVNLPAAPVYEMLTFRGAGAVALVKNGNSPKIETAKLVVKTNVTAPFDIADFSGARVSVDSGKTLTFDFTTYSFEGVTGVTTQQVTGVTTRADDRFDIGSTSDWASRLNLIYDANEYTYSVVIDPAATVTKDNTTVAYPTVAAALTAFSTDAGTLRLFVDYDQDITLSVGQSLDTGSTTYTGTVSVTGEHVECATSGTTYTAVDNSTNTWAPVSGGGNRWETAANWSNGVVPNTYTAVTFPASENGHVVYLTHNNTAPQHHCASMAIVGDVTFQRGAGVWAYVLMDGNITGTGTMTLEQVGIKTADNGSVTISCPVVGNAAANDNFFAGNGATYTFSSAVNVSAGEFKAEYTHLVFNGLVTICDGAFVKANGSGATATFNGGIAVPENAAASLTIDSGTHTIASTVTLASGATLTVPTAATTVSGATFATSVADSYVKATAGESTTVYSVAAKTGVTVSVGSNVSLTINGTAVADGDTLKFAPGDTFTYVATPAANYTATVTVTGGTDNDGTVTVGETAITVAATATRDAVTVSNVEFEYGNDYATADVTATVSDPTATYKMTVGVNEYTGSVSGTTVTFSGVATGHSSAYDSVSYEITATDGTSSVVVSGGSGSAVAADTTAWFSQSSANSGNPVNGSWTTEVNLSTPTNVTDNTFAATAPSTSSRVVLEFEVCFSSTSEDDVTGEAQAAIKLGVVNSVTTFMVLTNGNEWAAVSAAGLEPDASATYKVVLTIDYGSNTYGVTVGNYVLTNGTGSASFPLAASRTSVQNIDFAGSGTLTSLKGDQVEGYMVVDKNGTRYASISAAITAYLADPTIAPLRVLHDGTAPSGWKIVTEGGVDILKKIAKGLFFMAY